MEDGECFGELVLVVFGVEADEGGDGADLWLGGLGLCEGAREGEDRGEGEALHSMAPEKMRSQSIAWVRPSLDQKV